MRHGLTIFSLVCVLIAGTAYAGIVVGNAGFDAIPLSSGGYTYNIAPWVTPNDGGGHPAWISNNYYAGEPPTVPAIYCTGGNVYQKLGATFVDGGAYTFKIDTGTRTGQSNLAWKIYIYDATTGTYQTPLSVNTGTIPASGQWYPATVTYLAAAGQAGHQIGIGFTGGYYAMFDNAEVGPPLKAWGPDPANGAIDVGINKILSWMTGCDPNDPAKANPAITQHFVWMSSGNPADPNLVKVATVPAVGDGASYNPGGLLRDKTYYWRIDERLTTDANVITGDVWMFKTVPSTPIIVADTPQDVYVAVGENAVFTVTATNPFTGDNTGLKYEWFKVGTPDTAVGTDSATLTVANVQIANEGSYYCRVSVVAVPGSTSTSRSARLTIKKLVAHWPFDGDASDSSGFGNNGTSMNGPTFGDGVPGLPGQAIVLDGTDDYVDVPVAVFNQLNGREITISLWTKRNTPLENQTTIGAYDDTGNRMFSSHLPWGNGIVYWDNGNPTGYDRIE